jgi:3-isopropylmalate/(R)-2-methylmalate dehydratase large subunit
VVVGGRLPRWVGAFDLAVALADLLAAELPLPGAVIELHGPAIVRLTVPERLSLCQALALAGRVALVPPDEATAVWLAARRSPDRPATAPSAPTTPGPDHEPDEALSLSARKVALVALAGGFSGERLRPGPEAGHPVDEVILGGHLEALQVGAEALSERRLHPGLRLLVVPDTRRTLLHAIESGLAAALVRSGAILLPPGADPPPAAPGSERVTTVPTGAGDLLVGPAVAGASAVAGRLIDPESMRRERRRASSQR